MRRCSSRRVKLCKLLFSTINCSKQAKKKKRKEILDELKSGLILDR